MLRETYWLNYPTALMVANRKARSTGVRHRVQRRAGTTLLGDPGKWHVSPTLAPAPEVAEPCS